jgi:hypothetical protein
MAAPHRDRLSPSQLLVVQHIAHAEAGRKGSWDPDRKAGRPNTAVVVDNRAVFEMDHLGRTVRATTVLDQLAPDSERNKEQQQVVGGTDRLATDDGGHIFATLFGGLGEGINIQPMDFPINRGAYQTLETLWSSRLRAAGWSTWK